MQQERIPQIVRFGSFELDSRSGELFSCGRKIPLQEQPFRIVELLTDSAGELVTREEIRRRLWPDDTVVEFENAVNAAIKKLRIALGDSAEDPRYIQTLRGRGYRLMVPVEHLPIAASSPASNVVPLHVDLDRSPSLEAGVSARRTRPWRVLAAAAMGLSVIFVYVHSYLHRIAHAAPKLSVRDKIVLGDFINNAKDPVFSYTLRQGLAVQLDQSPVLSLLSENTIQKQVALMAQPADTPVTPAIAWQICQRTGSAVVLDGSIDSLGTQYILWLRARNCHSGDVIDQEQVAVAKKEDVLNALSEVAGRFRSRVGESLGQLDKFNTPLAEATTPSLDALKAYSLGMDAISHGGSLATLPMFRRATEIDPGFAMAYAMLGRSYGDIGASKLSEENTRKAWELRGRTNEKERFFIDASYQIQVAGNLEEAEQICEAWVRAYPADRDGLGFLAGMIYPVIGKYELAVEESRKLIQLDPDFAVGYNLLSLGLMPLGLLNAAADALHQADERGLQMSDLLVDRYQLAFLNGDYAEMEKVRILSLENPGEEDAIVYEESLTAAYAGRLKLTRNRSEMAMRLARQTGGREREAMFQTGAALGEGFLGDIVQTRRSASEALKLSNGRDVEYGSAFALALAGDTVRSQTLADDLERRLPEDSAVKFDYVPTLRALAALNRHNPGDALERLQLTRRHELGQPQSCFYGYFGVLYPVYIRGEAYLALHQGTLAAAEFQKVLDHRNTVVNDPIGALAHLQLGRALAMAGDQAKARAAYNDFFALWKNADPDIPVLEQARFEYSKIH